MPDITKRYRQAKELANTLFDDIEPDKYNFKRLFEQLEFDEEIIFNDLISLKSTRTKVKKHLIYLCERLDNEYVIPGLIEYMSRFYMDRPQNKSTMAGLAAKLLISFTWTNQYNGHLGTGRSINAILTAHECCTLFALLEQVILIWEFEDLGTVTFTSKGRIENARFQYLQLSFNKQGPHEYKVLDDAMQYVWQDENIWVHLHAIISGFAPKDGKVFGDSFLSEIPASQTRFWNRFWSLMQLYFLALRGLNGRTEEFFSLCIIPQGIILSPTNPGGTMQQDIFDSFWQPDWHKEKLTKEYVILQNMIIDRPMVRITMTENLFGTSIVLLQDSVNFLLEKFLHSGAGDRLYEKYFSGPFETRVLEMLRQYGYICGEVTMQGQWRKKDQPEHLRSTKKMPGQIDVLAISKEKHICLLADCKMLYFPNNTSARKNLRSKFSDDDSEGFYSKLRKKQNWLDNCAPNPANGLEIIPLLITHRHIPLPITNRGLVLSIEELEHYLKVGIHPKDWICGGWNA
ncbi:hypothetical protein IDJ75_04830 [Mucilaginibacter rigui]|uniref:NERD domain-containing protein n=1 Tax=Mucilaginibacter rigui TaxID=534635 RepID=A0ABR7X1W3_9SPHI|nr:hypothetical protein [Mucilaginibacter rigui]MBD1384594.1 hypothetical protein [Mucilaginibacter rigui]